MPFISGGILYPLSVEYFKRSTTSYSLFFSSAQKIPFLSLCLFTLLSLVFQQPLSEFLKVKPVWIWIMPLSVWAIMVNEVVMLICRNKSKPVQFAFFSIGKNALEVVLTIIFVIVLRLSWQGRLLSAFLAPALLAVFSFYLFYRWGLFIKGNNAENIKKIFLTSIPFIFERLSIFVMGYSDKYFINKFDHNGTAEVGLYGLASQLASIIYIVILSFNSAYHPHLFKKLADGFTGRIHKSTLLYIAATGLAVVGIFVSIPLLFKYFIGIRFHDAQFYAYILTGGYFLWGVYNAFVGYLLYLTKNRQIFYISVAGMVVSLSLNSLLVPLYGALGAAVTSVVTYFSMACFCFLYVRKYFLSEDLSVK